MSALIPAEPGAAGAETRLSGQGKVAPPRTGAPFAVRLAVTCVGGLLAAPSPHNIERIMG